jgi:GNAT superfamily N-acetyltransferase
MDRIKNFVTQPASPWISQQETTAFSRSLAGEFADTGDDYFFLLSVGDQFVSHAWYSGSLRSPEIAVLGYVFTEPAWRGRGFSNLVLKALTEHFASRGGQAIFLGTDSPAARNLYAKHGFTDYNGEVMRSLPGDLNAAVCDERTFEAGQSVSVRPAEWGDLALATALYTSPFSWIVRDFTENIVIGSGAKLTRCVSIFVALMLRSELPGNSMFVLQTTRGALVGCASIIPSPNGKPLLEFLVHPNYACEALSFLQPLLKGETGFVCHAAEEDIIKRDILKNLGFIELRRHKPGLVTLQTGPH